MSVVYWIETYSELQSNDDDDVSRFHLIKNVNKYVLPSVSTYRGGEDILWQNWEFSDTNTITELKDNNKNIYNNIIAKMRHTWHMARGSRRVEPSLCENNF